jgi:hypothetical protein
MDFVVFELSKKLKEKGFPQVKKGTLAMYDERGEWYSMAETIDEAYLFEDFDEHDCVCPTISQVLKWLREEKEIYIVIQPFPTMATKNKICWSWDFKWNSDGVYIEHMSPDYVTYSTYEQAALAGIEYILGNLI